MKILIVEDNNGDYDYISLLLKEESGLSMQIIRSTTLEEARSVCENECPDLILLDLGLPDSKGIDTAVKVIEFAQRIPVIVLTGFQSEETGLRAIKSGAQDYICKNELSTNYLIKSIKYSLERKKHEDDLKSSRQKITYLLDYYSDGVCVVDNSLKVHEINNSFSRLFNISHPDPYGKDLGVVLGSHYLPIFQDKLNQISITRKHQLFDYNVNDKKDLWYEIKLDPYPEGIIIFVRDISENVAEQKMLNDLNETLRKSTDSTIKLLSELVELKEPYTAGHQERVAQLCSLIADEIKLPRKQKIATVLAARIHDIGKTAIPSEILVKPSSLSENEMSLIRHHVLSGYNLVKKIETDLNLADIIMQHHERINGSGYPNGITDKQILTEAKILGVADVVDAMLSHRPYRTARTKQEVIEELEKNKGILYDPTIVFICKDILETGRFEVKPPRS